MASKCSTTGRKPCARFETMITKCKFKQGDLLASPARGCDQLVGRPEGDLVAQMELAPFSSTFSANRMEFNDSPTWDGSWLTVQIISVLHDSATHAFCSK
mmetsp:Transcript_14811/g.47180  ORF Transcript_14811/g.47180 Transcript_14811/m.47180 type:complete len:100 (-) Transcript_14811:720-1019(-)